jgi:hypothetical protein
MFIFHFIRPQGVFRIQTLIRPQASKPRLQAGIFSLVLVLSCTTGSSEMNGVCAHDRRTHQSILPCWFHFLLICPFRSSSFQPLDSKVSRCRIFHREARADLPRTPSTLTIHGVAQMRTENNTEFQVGVGWVGVSNT